jgi:hypothetical protein
MHSTCRTAQKNVQDIYRDLENGVTLNQASSHGLRDNLKSYVFKWLQNLPGISEAKKAEYKTKMGVDPKSTAGSENPNYVLYWTNEDLLSLFSLSLASAETNISYPLVPSSQIILRFYLDNANLMVDGMINDQQVPLTHCGGANSCNAEDFGNSLISSIANISDISAFCNPTTAKK